MKIRHQLAEEMWAVHYGIYKKMGMRLGTILSKNRRSEKLNSGLLISKLCIFIYLATVNQAFADYQIPALDTYSCARYDGRIGSTGNWLSRQETANKFGQLTVLQYPAFTHWWVWYAKPFVPSLDYECMADNGLPYIPFVTTSPPYDGFSAPMSKVSSCSYRTLSGTVTIGQLGSYNNGNGTYGYTCTISSTLNPKSLGTCPVGNPISPSTGNKSLIEHDYSSVSLSYSRWYNSAFIGAYQTVGSKWRHSYNKSLAVIGGNKWKAILFREDGRIFEFRLQANEWLPDTDISDRLLELKDTNGIRTGWRYTVANDDSVETYSALGKLLSISDRTGHTQILTYNQLTINGGDDDPETLDTVTDDVGRQLRFSYDAYKRIATVTAPAGGAYHYGYDTNNNLVSVTYPDGTSKTYHYENTGFPHALTGITDENGSRYATYSYDAQGRGISTEHAGGAERVSLAYNADGSTTVTDALNTARTYQFQSLLGVVKPTGQSQPGGSGCNASASALIYDANGNVTSRTDFNGNRTDYAYDLTRNLETSRTEGLTANGATTPATRTITTLWHPTLRRPVQITAGNQQTTYTYNPQGDVTEKTVTDLVTNTARTWTTTYTYGAVPGVLVQKVEDGPRTDVSDVTTYDYYPADASCAGGHFGCRGQLQQLTDPLGHITQYTAYDANGKLLSLTDANGLVTTLTYDARQRLLSLDSGGETTTYAYDPAGLLTRVTRPDGSYLAYSYDAAHRLIQTQDNLGNTVTYTLDALGNRIKEEAHDPSGQLARSQTRVYDALSRLQNLIQPQ